MQGYNLLAVYNEDGSRLLLCRRKKEPYRGLLNLTGGKIEPGENGIDAAYRELWEETSIDREEIQLVHLMDFTYPAGPVLRGGLCWTAETQCAGIWRGK